MLSKIKLILNPICNHGRSLQCQADLRPLLEGRQADWSETQSPGHASDLACQAGEQDFDMVVAVGGDGTVHEVVNGLMRVPKEKRPSLGIVPVGSGNDFAHILQIPADPVEALRSALEGMPRRLDVVSARDETGRLEFFNNTIGIGFDAIVNEYTRQITRIHGFMMYFVALIQTIFRRFNAVDLHVETDRESWDLNTLLLALGNGPREGGGFLVTPEAKYDDGLLNYVTIRKISRLMMLRLVPEVMNGTHGRFKVVKMGTCVRMIVKSQQSLYVHLDGEIFAGFGSDIRQLTIEILPGAIHFRRE